MPINDMVILERVLSVMNTNMDPNDLSIICAILGSKEDQGRSVQLDELMDCSKLYGLELEEMQDAINHMHTAFSLAPETAVMQSNAFFMNLNSCSGGEHDVEEYRKDLERFWKKETVCIFSILIEQETKEERMRAAEYLIHEFCMANKQNQDYYDMMHAN